MRSLTLQVNSNIHPFKCLELSRIQTTKYIYTPNEERKIDTQNCKSCAVKIDLRTHGQSQRGKGLRVGVGVGEVGDSGGWKMETTVLEQQ